MTVSPEDAPRPPSLLRSFVPPILFLLLCGIVGPIFLIAGLLVEDEPGTGWLLPTGIGITALDLVIGALIGRARHRSQQKVHRLRRNGRRAQAKVLSFDETGVRINDQPMIALRLRIHGNDVTPFEVEGNVVVSEVRLPLLYAGDLPVLVDPESQEWEIDWESARALPPVSPVPAAGGAAPVETRTAGERLAELDDLLRQDLISREEYDAARARIIAEL